MQGSLFPAEQYSRQGGAEALSAQVKAAFPGVNLEPITYDPLGFYALGHFGCLRLEVWETGDDAVVAISAPAADLARWGHDAPMATAAALAEARAWAEALRADLAAALM